MAVSEKSVKRETSTVVPMTTLTQTKSSRALRRKREKRPDTMVGKEPIMHDIPGITRAFDIEDKGDTWHLHCKLCRMGWSLSKKKNVHPGNILALLNHAAGCEKKQQAANKRNRDKLNDFFGGRR